LEHESLVANYEPIRANSDDQGESAVEEEYTMIETHFRPPVTQPFSKLHGYWTPAESFQGWKGIDVKGKLASKSFGDLQMLNSAWPKQRALPRRRGTCAAGDAPFEKLPIEILSRFSQLSIAS
jgi:hypothetical protein